MSLFPHCSLAEWVCRYGAVPQRWSDWLICWDIMFSHPSCFGHTHQFPFLLFWQTKGATNWCKCNSCLLYSQGVAKHMSSSKEYEIHRFPSPQIPKLQKENSSGLQYLGVSIVVVKKGGVWCVCLFAFWLLEWFCHFPKSWKDDTIIKMTMMAYKFHMHWWMKDSLPNIGCVPKLSTPPECGQETS